MTDSASSGFTFIHTADLHLDTPFRGIHDVAPAVAVALREASLQAFDNIVDLAITEHAAFVVFAGDIYDGAERGLRAQLRFRDGLAKLSDHGIMSFVVHGNHDPVTTGWSAINGSWPERTTIFPADNVAVVPVVVDGEQIATVQGMSYAVKATTENLSLRYKRPKSDGFHVGVLHCNVAGVATGYDDYSPCSVDDLRASKLDYFALGHIHQRQVVHESSGSKDPWIVYAGNSQARSPRHSEQEPKGATVVRVAHGAVRSLDFVPCDVVRFRYRECAITTIADLGELEDRLQEIAADELVSAEGRSVVLRVTLTGRGAVHDDLSRPNTMDELMVRLRESLRDGQVFCWWDEVEDDTQPIIDLATLRGRGDFSADLLELSDELREDGDAREALGSELAAAVPRTLSGRIQALMDNPEQLQEIFERATVLAFDELSRDGA